ncbi:MAG: hypothetical protein ACJAVV_001084 [Alphaproteobacteria bacterium]|jgi:hypothetical protein
MGVFRLVLNKKAQILNLVKGLLVLSTGVLRQNSNRWQHYSLNLDS